MLLVKKWLNFKINGLENFQRISKNCIFCDKSKIFVNRAFICNSNANCSMDKNYLEKEIFCKHNFENQFQCDETRLLDFHFVCNHINDCNDQTDEKFCSKNSINYLFKCLITIFSEYETCKDGEMLENNHNFE